MSFDSTSIPSAARGEAKPVAIGLSWLERAALFVGITEIPLQIDKYFFFHEEESLIGAVAGLNVSITTFAILFLYGIWFADASLQRRRTILRPLFGIPMLFYLAIVLLSTVSAPLPIFSMFDFVLLTQSYLLFFYIANRVQTHRDLLFCLLSLAAILFVQGVLMFGVAATGLSDEELRVGPLVFNVQDGNRHAGTMYSPVLAGSTLALIWLPVAASLLFIRGKWSWRLAMAATMVGLIAILMTQTRGAILTTFVGSIIIGIGMLRRGWLPKWTMVFAVVLLMISIYPMVVVYQNRIQHGDGESASSRKHLSMIALELIAQRPIMGHGAGNCHYVGKVISDQADYRGEWYYTIHSKYLVVWVETGLVGLLAFLWILGNGMRQGFAAWRTRDPAIGALGLALVAALAGHMLHMSVDIFNSRPQVQMLWAILGIVAAVYKLSNQDAFAIAVAPRQSRKQDPNWASAAPFEGGVA